MWLDRRFLLAHYALVAVLLLIFAPGSLLAEEPTPAAMEAWVKRQMADHRLTVEFYDAAKPPRPYPGWTDFEFRLEYQYEYKVDLPKKKSARGMAVIVPTFSKIEVPVKNHVLLPKSSQTERWFEGGLAKHELEHVRVGVHPRLTMLGRHLVQKVTRIEVPADKLADATPEWIAARVDAAVVPRRDAIQALVTSINRKIDMTTNHGAVPLPNLDEFLDGLYLKENLDELKFPYLADVLDLIGTSAYQQAKLVIREANTAPQSGSRK